MSDSDLELFLKPILSHKTISNVIPHKGTTLKCYVVLPCYNEARNLESLIKSIDESLGKRIPYEIVAVNDGSIDGTREVLMRLSSQYPVKVVDHSQNLGLAEALKTGFKAVIEDIEDDDYVVFMDSDNTHNPRYIPLMINAARKFDLVIGSRYVKNGRQINVPYIRIFMSKAINYLIKLLLKAKVKDFTSGYRCFRASTIKTLYETFGDHLIVSQGFEASFEVLLKALTCNFKVGEIPIVLDYGLKNGKSKMRLIPTILNYMRFLLSLKSKLKISI